MRIRLLRDPGVQGAQGLRIQGGAGELQSGDHYDRSRDGGRDLHRAAQRGPA